MSNENDALEQRFPFARPLREAMDKVEEARKLAEAMPVGLVRTKALAAVREMQRKHTELRRGLLRAEALEAAANRTLDIVLPRGVIRGRRPPN
jgi:hypothetical protein